MKFQYKNWENKVKYVCKRGFQTKHEATEWEESFMRELREAPDITFGEFWHVYLKDREARLKQSTMDTKVDIVETKILPYFKDRILRTISPTDVIAWQNKLLKAKVPGTGIPYSTDYLRTVHNQLSCIFNHAVRYYKLGDNPAKIAGNMGKSKKTTDMLIWTQDEYKRFAKVMMDNPIMYYVFEVLYWMGVRKGEMMALTKADVNLETRKMTINKTLYVKGQIEMVTSPKTEESNRIISIPQFLCDELEEYFAMNYDLKETDRIFPVSRDMVKRSLESGAKKAGLQRIRVHDLRHSHVSLLIDRGYNAVQIGRRVGHSSSDITYRYAHLFPNAQKDMADTLDEVRGGLDDEEEG